MIFSPLFEGHALELLERDGDATSLVEQPEARDGNAPDRARIPVSTRVPAFERMSQRLRELLGDLLDAEAMSQVMKLGKSFTWSSSPGESHPRALPEPYVSLSTHTAPTTESSPSSEAGANARITADLGARLP